VANEFLRGFIAEYSSTDFASMGGVIQNTNQFRGFSSKLLDCINSSARAILYDRLFLFLFFFVLLVLKFIDLKVFSSLFTVQRRSRGIENVFLYDRKEELFSVERVEDSLGIAANLRALINFSSDISTLLLLAVSSLC